MSSPTLAGHSDGARYLRGADVAALERCAATLLMGCSSGPSKPNCAQASAAPALNAISECL